MFKVVRLSNKKFFVEKAPRYVFWISAVFKFIYINLCSLQIKYPIFQPLYRWFTRQIYSHIVYFVKLNTKIYIGESVNSKMRLYPIKKDRK